MSSEEEADDRMEESPKRKTSSNMASSKRRKINKADLYKPPTNEELTSLKETESLYQSSLFKLQMDELRSELEVKEKKKKALVPVLHSLKEILRKIPPLVIPEASKPDWLPKGVQLPVQWEKTQIKGQLRLTKPTGVKVVGSYLLETCMSSDLNIDVAVEIPIECLQPKDYLNFRYHHKRALYCAYLVKHLKKKDLVDSVSYSTFDGDYMKPVVLLKLSSVKNAVVKLIPCLPEDGFKESRFAPSKSNVRRQWYSKDCTEETFSPTPHYNTSVLRDMYLEKHLHFLYNAAHDFPGFKDGVLLLRVWLHQRQLDKGRGGFNGFLVSMLVAHLLDTGKVHKMMSGYQVMKNCLHFLATSDWTRRGITLCKESSGANAPSLDEFHRYFSVVLVDPSGYLNLCSSMTSSTYEHIKHEARLGVGYLDDGRVDSFQCLFMTPVPFTRKFDHLVIISDVHQLKSSVKRLYLSDQLMDRAGNYPSVVLPGLVNLMKKALGERIQLFTMSLNQSREWSVSSSPPRIEQEGPLTFGLLLNASVASSILDKGPPANTPEAAEFSQFWGTKCELRRFQDGSICEAVVWPGVSVAEKRLVCGHIIRHILELHAGIKPSSVSYTGGQLDSLLQPVQPLSPPHGDNSTPPSRSTGEEETSMISAAYTKLSKLLRGLKDLPLAIASVQGTSPAFRHAEVHPPSPGCPPSVLRNSKPYIPVCLPSRDKQCPAWVPSLNVVCHLESSGKWPDDLEAIHHIKAAFHLKLAELLRKQCSIVTMATSTHVFVLLDGFVFQVTIAHRREIVLLKEVITKEGLSMLRDNERSMAIERETEHLPHLTSLLNGVQQHHTAYGPTVRLAKRWVSSHLLADHVNPECIELLVAYIFLHPAPFTVPSCPQTGFLHFLNLLSRHDWESTPLVINFNNDLDASNYEEIREHFTKNRSHLPNMFLATPADKMSSLWTKEKPTKQIFKRLIALSNESLTVLQGHIMTRRVVNDNDIKQIFRPPLDPYDVIIHLRHKLLPRRNQAVDAAQDSDGEKKPTTTKLFQDSKHIPVINFDPVQCFLQELREAFDDVALFFHDTYGGDIVAVLWRRPAFKPQPFKPMQAQAKMPKVSASTTAKTPEVVPNIEAILQDFQTLGRGLVTSVEVRTDNWDM